MDESWQGMDGSREQGRLSDGMSEQGICWAGQGGAKAGDRARLVGARAMCQLTKRSGGREHCGEGVCFFVFWWSGGRGEQEGLLFMYLTF